MCSHCFAPEGVYEEQRREERQSRGHQNSRAFNRGDHDGRLGLPERNPFSLKEGREYGDGYAHGAHAAKVDRINEVSDLDPILDL